MEYNLLKESWIEAVYSDGTRKEIGIIEAFQDAEKIKDIETPIFHGSKFWLHEMNVILLLSAIVTSAYNRCFEKGGAAKDTYIKQADKDGLWSEIIQRYLREFENRFDLFDAQHPFLQEISAKEDKAHDSPETALNPLSPAKANAIFGMTRLHNKNVAENYRENYKISFKEFAYLIIHSATTSQITNTYAKAVSAKVRAFVLLKGKNLKETILNNCTTTGEEDKPIWEMDSIEDYEHIENLQKCVLACLYFPYSSIYAVPDEKSGYIKSVIIRKESTIKTKEPFRFKLGAESNNKDCPGIIKNILPDIHPYALRTITPKKENKEEIETKYQFYTKEQKAWMMCMLAAKDVMHNNRPMEICRRLKRDYDMVFYCREYDEHTVTILSCRKFQIKGLPWLQTEEGQMLAEDYKTFYSRAEDKFKEAVKIAMSSESVFLKGNESSELNKAMDIVSPKIEQYFIYELYDKDLDFDSMGLKAREFIKKVFVNVYEEVLKGNISPCQFAKGYSVITKLSIKDKKKEGEIDE